jgi:ArsR family transcriptional regulator
MDSLLTGLRAAGEPTRLRLLAVCAHGELTVGELTTILDQSQPRVSRHLKLMVEAGLLQRFREGAQVYYRLAEIGESATLARSLVDLLPTNDSELNRDLAGLDAIWRRRATLADAYFNENAARWDEIRQLHVAEADVEQRLLDVVGRQQIETHVDIGTGTGRILALLSERVERSIGLDTNTEMLTLARTYLERENIKNAHVRKGDMYGMPLEDASADLATLHLVLHYSLEPAAVIAEAARVLRKNGRLIIVDFASHFEEQLRTEHQHQRLGFGDKEVIQAMEDVGLHPRPTETLAGDPITVKIWQGIKY